MTQPSRVGRYEILERLGEGGMGAVYLGRDPVIDRPIAVKVLHGHVRDPHLHQRFIQEARSAGSLAHPNIVTVHDFGEVDGAPYLVMELVQGRQVASLIKRQEPVPLATKLEWLEGLCAGLHYAHERRIIHRDVKPQNLMIDERGTLKILDFGIARVAESGLTKMSMVIGTPGYMSPEQIESRAIDRRSDVFSAGSVAYALLSYREAFDGDSVAAVMHRVIAADPPALTDVCRGLPTAVAAVVERALRKSPEERFQTAAEMQRAFAAARRALPADAPEPETATRVMSSVLDPRTPPSPTPADFRRRRLEQIDRHVRDAREALASGRMTAATAAADAALILDPDHVEAQQLLHQAQLSISQTHPTAALASSRQKSTPIDTRVPSVPSTPQPSAEPPTVRAVPAVTAPPTPAPIAVPRTSTTPPPSVAAAPPPPSMREHARAAAVSPSQPGRRRWPWLAGAAVATLVAASVWLATSSRPAAPPSPEAEAESTGTPRANVQPPPEPSQAERTATEIERLLREAATAEAASRWGNARALYQDVLARAADHAGARAGLARVQARLAQASAEPPPPPPPPKKAEGPSAEDRVRADGLLRRATSKYEAGDYDGAIDDLNRALASVPGHEGAATLLKSVLRAKETEAKMPRRPPGRDLL